MTAVYLDVCCLNRPQDDTSQGRVRTEAEAVLLIVDRVRQGFLTLLSSEALLFEIEQSRDFERRKGAHTILSHASALIRVNAETLRRVEVLVKLGMDDLDAMHVALAEQGRAEALVTSDDRLLKAARRSRMLLEVRVLNPVMYAAEILEPDIDD